MRRIGQLGGRASVKKRLGLNGDAELRAAARDRLLQAIASSDEKVALMASRSIFSYGQTPVPADVPEPVPPVTMSDGSRATGISDVVRLANELGVDVGQDELRLEVERLRLENERLRSQLAD
jgi:hypothetical protein